MRLLLLFLPLFLLACSEPAPRGGGSRILMMGDSLLATHKLSGQSIGHNLEKQLGEPVTDRSVIGARVQYILPVSGSLGLKIARQYRPGPWDWVVLNGGGNDLWMGCGCGKCGGKLNRLIGVNGTGGDIPALIRQAQKGGAHVVYVGYLRSPGLGSPIEHCKNEADALEGRIAALAARDPKLTFVSLDGLVPHGDRSFFAVDMIHPSTKATKAIAGRIAGVIAP